MDREKAINQVKALLARGDSPHEEEARTSLFLAHKKMREHGLTYGDLDLANSAGEPLSEEELEQVQIDAVCGYMQVIGSHGGQARKRSLTRKQRKEIAQMGVEGRLKKVGAKRRSEIASKAAKTRWGG